MKSISRGKSSGKLQVSFLYTDSSDCATNWHCASTAEQASLQSKLAHAVNIQNIIKPRKRVGQYNFSNAIRHQTKRTVCMCFTRVAARTYNSAFVPKKLQGPQRQEPQRTETRDWQSIRLAMSASFPFAITQSSW